MLKQITPERMKEEIKSQAGDKSVKNMMEGMGLGMFAGEVCILIVLKVFQNVYSVNILKICCPFSWVARRLEP